MAFDYEKNIWGQGIATEKWIDPANVRLRRILKSFSSLSENAKILEVGCGAGTFIRALKEKNSGWQCFGTDISDQAILAARSVSRYITFEVCGENRLPFADNSFDGVFFTDVLEHVIDPKSFLLEISRVLKAGGALYAFVPCEGDSTSFWRWLSAINLKKDLTKKYAGHINFFSRLDVKKLFEQCGLSISKIKYSEHLVGQLLGLAVFYSLDHSARKSGQQINNTAFVRDFSAKRGKFFRLFKSAVNWLITLESEIFACFPSPNMHISAVKK